MAKPLILVVDDEKAFADTVAQAIGETGKYETLTAYSAREALAHLRKNKKLFGVLGNKIRLIILDIKMPGMDGLQLLEKIRQEYGIDIGIAMLTAWEDEEKWEKATSGFIVNYIRKPLEKKELLETVDRFFRGEDAKMTLDTFEKHIDKMAEFKQKREGAQ